MDAEQAMAKALEGQFWGWVDYGHKVILCDLKKKPAEPLPVICSVSGRITADSIVRAVCVASGVSLPNTIGRSRIRKYVHARQAAMWLAHDMTELSLWQIGKSLGGRDHTTILHGIRTVDEYPDRFADVITKSLQLLDASNLRKAS